MQSEEDEELNEKLFLSEKEKERLKQQVLEEDFKKALKPKKVTGKEVKAVSKIKEKRKFAKFGFGLMFIAIICIVVLNIAPWMYIKFDSGLEGKTLEKVYDRYFEVQDGNESLEVLYYFQYDNSSIYLGISSDGFTNTANRVSYVFYSLIVLGVLFTAFEFWNKKRKVAYQKAIIVYTVFSAISAILCIYILFLTVKFFGIHFLLYHNISYINPSLPNIIIIFIAPVFFIFMAAGLLKISFTTMKINYNLCEKLTEEKKPKKSLYHFKREDRNK